MNLYYYSLILVSFSKEFDEGEHDVHLRSMDNFSNVIIHCYLLLKWWVLAIFINFELISPSIFGGKNFEIEGKNRVE